MAHKIVFNLVRTTLVALAAILATGCAPVSPQHAERLERESAVMRAGELCERRYPGFRVIGLDPQGRAFTEYPLNSTLIEREDFRRCVNDAMERAVPAR